MTLMDVIILWYTDNTAFTASVLINGEIREICVQETHAALSLFDKLSSPIWAEVVSTPVESPTGP